MIDISKQWSWEDAKQTDFTFIDVFCGAGGLSCGLEHSGMKGVCGLDIFKEAVETYSSYFKHSCIEGDITLQSTKEELYNVVKSNLIDKEIDLVAGGFPCQGFSMAGKRMIDDPRNILYKELLQVIDHLKPRFILFENVKGIRSMKKGEVVKQIVEDAKDIGYILKFETLNSADYYVPQKRERVIFIGIRRDLLPNLSEEEIKDLIDYPKPLISEEDYICVGDAIWDLIDLDNDPSFNHIITKHSEEMIERLSMVKEGKSLYENFSDSWRRCFWNKPSNTIKENHGGVIIHPLLNRVLTPRELARLQSFPDDFIFKGTKSKQLVQIGNAVPPFLGNAIGLAILEIDRRVKKLQEIQKE